MTKIDRSYLRYLRYAVQWGIVFSLLYAGYEFSLFVSHFESGASGISLPPSGSRPPSVEGFLPIGALMAFKLWVTTGIFDSIHPAALIIFLAAMLMSLLLKKSFCGWICPVGAISDVTGKIGKKLIGTNFRIYRYLDLILRSSKYLLMAFFIYIVVLRMSPPAILQFLGGNYYKIADVKMLYFFTGMTRTTLITLVILTLLSLIYRNFWCRYLCPYGALLGLLGVCSPLKITRNEDACIHCRKCTEHCPALIPVERQSRVWSPECTGCLTCVSHCPAKGALDMAVKKGRILNPLVFALLAAVLFFSFVGFGKVTGRWDSAVTNDDYKRLVPLARSLDHP